VSVRLVPLLSSLTEPLCALGLRAQLASPTRFCIHPRDSLRSVPKVGGTKDVDVERVRRLAPTHLVVNVDENDKSTVELLAAQVPNLIVTHPLTVEDNLALFAHFGDVFAAVPGGREAAARLSRSFVVIPWPMRVVALALRAMPNRLFDALFARAPRKRRLAAEGSGDADGAPR